MYRGGDQLLYRLTVEQQATRLYPGASRSLKSLYLGQQDTIQVRVRRRSGWNSPVEVWAEGLPSAIAVDRQSAEPKDSIVKDTCGVDRVIDGTIVLLPGPRRSERIWHFDFKIKGAGSHGWKYGGARSHRALSPCIRRLCLRTDASPTGAVHRGSGTSRTAESRPDNVHTVKAGEFTGSEGLRSPFG